MALIWRAALAAAALAAASAAPTEGLGSQCGPSNLELCGEAEKTLLEQFGASSTEELDRAIQARETVLAKLDADFKLFVGGLQKEYLAASDKKDRAVAAVKAGRLGLLKSVQAHAKREGRAEL
mmetsp:Transcript_33297/g.97055  ORF Transcript_33297/g.97055 Transcript_33297/m.97055 type:complete len:123 (+) Transcript_33297:36-404(+)